MNEDALTEKHLRDAIEIIKNQPLERSSFPVTPDVYKWIQQNMKELEKMFFPTEYIE